MSDNNNQPDTPTGLREFLADHFHRAWCHWSKDIADEEDISQERLDRWKGLWVPYADLPEDVKETDRDFADEVLAELPQRPFETDCWVLRYSYKPEDHKGDPHWKIAGVYLSWEAVEAAEADLRERHDSVKRTRHGSRKSPKTLHVPEADPTSFLVPVFSRKDVFDVCHQVRRDAREETDGFRAGMEAAAKQIQAALLEGFP